MTAERGILLIDDDPDIRDALGECLRDEGYEVYPAEHGKAALDLLEHGLRPGVILLDLMMPVMNGFEFLEALHARPECQHVRVLILSANQGYQAADFVGVFQMLRKPVLVEHLCRELERALAA